MRCANTNCGKELQAGSKFCPFCGTRQPTATTAPQQKEPYAPQPVTRVQPVALPTGEVLVMRAGEQIWHFTEPEGEVRPGQRRPLLIVDEQVVHLAHTDRRLEAQELLQRVRSILEMQDVPVDVQLVNSRWLSDSREVRPRLVASLRNHPYSDIKMIMGVDYMGRWASIQLHLGVEPEPLPLPPPKPSFKIPEGVIALWVMGAIMWLIGSALDSGWLSFIGFALLIVGFAWYRKSKTKWENKHLEELMQWEAEQRRRALEKAAERLTRTFKVDDMRLFCTAMRQVFQVGAEVVRIEGGRGGYFQVQGIERPAPTSRRIDAAQAGV
jgi:hypothetical protein